MTTDHPDTQHDHDLDAAVRHAARVLGVDVTPPDAAEMRRLTATLFGRAGDDPDEQPPTPTGHVVRSEHGTPPRPADPDADFRNFVADLFGRDD